MRRTNLGSMVRSNVIGSGEWVESPCRRYCGRFGNEASRSEGSEYLRRRSGPNPSVQYTLEPCMGDYVVKIVSS